MFSISNDKNKITCKRTLVLAKSGILPADKLDCTISVDLGIDLNAAEGKAIVGKFGNLFNSKISGKIKGQDDRIERSRKRLAKMMHDGDSENKTRQYADTEQEDIVRDWNTFSRVDLKRAALDAIDDSIKSLGKKTSIVFKDLKIKFDSNSLNDQRMVFMTGVLDLAGKRGSMGRNTSGAMAGLQTTLSGINGNMRGYLGVWAANVKLYKQAAGDANAMRNNISAMGKASKSLSVRLERIKKIDAAAKSRMEKAAAQGERAVKELEKAAKTAVLNKQQKIAAMSRAAQKSFAEARVTAKKMEMKKPETAKLASLLKDIEKQLHAAEILSKNQSETVVDSAKKANEVFNDSRKGAQAVALVLKELKNQSKQL